MIHLPKFPAIIFTLILILPSCLLFDNDSINTLIKESFNQRHDKKAVLFLKEAGTTVSDSYQVTVEDASKKFEKQRAGNTFTVDPNHGATKLDPTSINLNWIGNDTLQIDYDKKLRTFIKERNIDGVTIIYKAR